MQTSVLFGAKSLKLMVYPYGHWGRFFTFCADVFYERALYDRHTVIQFQISTVSLFIYFNLFSELISSMSLLNENTES